MSHILNFKTATVAALTGLALVAGAGCSQGLTTNDFSQDIAGNNNQQDTGGGGGNGGGGNSNPVRSWDDIRQKTDGAVDGWKYDGQVVVQIDAENQALVLVMPLPPIFLMPVASMPIPELPGAAIFPLTQPDGTSSMAVRIPLKYIVKGSSLSNYNTLPNGDPLPFMPVGENRGFAISFPQNMKYRLHLYISANAAAVFVETPDFKLPEQWVILPSLGFPVKNQDKTQVVGYFAVVANRGIHNSGVYVASRIPREVAILIDELIRY